jgi:hypothetical protein
MRSVLGASLRLADFIAALWFMLRCRAQLTGV